MSPRHVLRSLRRPLPTVQGSSALAGVITFSLGLALIPAGAQATGRHATRIIPAGTASTTRISDYSAAGGGVAALGDVNGDARDDIAVVTVLGALYGPQQSVVRVVFGTSSASYPGALDGLGSGGFTIRNGGGEASQVSSAGDFDGDGLKDILINRRTVVYGERGNTDIMFGPEGDARSTQLAVPTGADGFHSVGDFNGDGYDDLASSGDHQRTTYSLVTFGGPRVPTIALTGARTFRMVGWRRCVPLYLTPYGIGGGCKSYADVPEAAGDVNGDGIDDLFLRQNAVADGDQNTVVRSWVLFGRALAGGKAVDVRKTALAGSATVTEPGAENWWAAGGVFRPWSDGPGQDFDHDGIDDLRVSRKRDGATVKGYLPGVAGTADIVLSEATVRPYPEGALDDGYDPMVASTPDSMRLKNVPAVGDLDGDGRLDGAAAWTKYADLEPGSTDPAYPRGALVIFDGDEDRLPPVQYPHDPSAFGSSPEVSGWYADMFRFGAFEASTIEAVWRRAGETQPLVVVTFPPGTTTLPNAALYHRNGLAPGRYEIVTTAIDEAGISSEPQAWPFEVPAPGDLGSLPSLSGWDTRGTWQTFRAAIKLGDGSVQLTPAVPTVQGVVYWPLPIDRSAAGANTVTSIEFDAEMSGGSPAGGGMTVAFTKERTGVEAMPGTGSSLGFAPQTGIAFAMQTYKAVRTDPSANFVGFTDGKIPGSAPVALRWLATADPLISLRDTPFHVKVEISAQRKQAWINGTLVLSTAGDSTSARYLQFTASTGPGQNQRHVVRNVVFKQRAG